jgi:hypothetical protein
MVQKSKQNKQTLRILTVQASHLMLHIHCLEAENSFGPQTQTPETPYARSHARSGHLPLNTK